MYLGPALRKTSPDYQCPGAVVQANYVLCQAASQNGVITSLDFIANKSEPPKGKCRIYQEIHCCPLRVLNPQDWDLNQTSKDDPLIQVYIQCRNQPFLTTIICNYLHFLNASIFTSIWDYCRTHGTNYEFLMSLKSLVFLVIVSDIKMLVDLTKTNNAMKQTPPPHPKLQKNPLKDGFESQMAKNSAPNIQLKFVFGARKGCKC